MNIGPLLFPIVATSYKKGASVEDTILILRNQACPQIEHIVIDGRAKDGTIEILRKYSGDMVWRSGID